MMICDYEELPCRIGGLVRETCEPDGDYYTIIINSRLSYERQCDVYAHEMEHIENDDFHSERSVAEIENDRHK